MYFVSCLSAYETLFGCLDETESVSTGDSKESIKAASEIDIDLSHGLDVNIKTLEFPNKRL